MNQFKGEKKKMQSTSYQSKVNKDSGDLRIVNPDPRYAKVRLIEPSLLGYIHVAAEVSPKSLPFLPTDRDKSILLAELKEIARKLELIDSVERVTIFDGFAFPPASSYVREQKRSTPRFDIVALVETKSPADAIQVRSYPSFQALVEKLRSKAKHLHIMVGLNVKRVEDVDKTRKGLFLFNYFMGNNQKVALELWDYLAGWYEAETGLNNSTLLLPLEGEKSDYVFINNARWDKGLVSFVLNQMTKRTFRTYMMANLKENRVSAMPILYRLA
jgi:hypothetical protein